MMRYHTIRLCEYTLLQRGLRILLIVIALHAVGAAARPYRHTLDVAHAEEILSGITFGPRLADDEWLKLLKDQKNDKRQIQSGDNLWDISRKRFNNPFLWRKLWQENPWLTNPHELEVGRMLSFYREPTGIEAGVKRIPLIHLRPSKGGKYSDVDNDVYINRVIKTRHRISYFVLSDEELIGEITGAYTERKNLREVDEVYALLNEDAKVQMGDVYAVVHEDRVLRDKSVPGTPVIGKLMKVVGEIKILEQGEKRTKVEVLALFNEMHRGDKIARLPRIATSTAPENPPSNLVTHIVMGEEPDYNIFGQGRLVMLNKGSADGMKDGYVFRVYYDTDPESESRIGVDPSYKGEIRVVYTGRVASIGYIMRNKDPLRVGDTLIPFRAFKDPPPPPRKERHDLEIN